VTRAGTAMLEVALRPLADNPDLRHAILDLGRDLEQTIDEISLDTVMDAGYSAQARERAEALTRDFRRFIEEYRDEIHALQVLYSRPYRERLTFDAVKELCDAMERPPHRWTKERLWRAYDLLDRSKVRGSGERRLADVVSLVRYALQQEDELVPFEETARVRFASWLMMQEQRGATITAEQRTWLEWMRDVIATDLGISDVALDYPPFLTYGGLPRALQVFGERLRPLMEELTETLTA
jgi:type I restriction enzyme R subunit